MEEDDKLYEENVIYDDEEPFAYDEEWEDNWETPLEEWSEEEGTSDASPSLSGEFSDEALSSDGENEYAVEGEWAEEDTPDAEAGEGYTFEGREKADEEAPPEEAAADDFDPKTACGCPDPDAGGSMFSLSPESFSGALSSFGVPGAAFMDQQNLALAKGVMSGDVDASAMLGFVPGGGMVQMGMAVAEDPSAALGMVPGAGLVEAATGQQPISDEAYSSYEEEQPIEEEYYEEDPAFEDTSEFDTYDYQEINEDCTEEVADDTAYVQQRLNENNY